MKPCRLYSFPWAMCQTESFRRSYVRATKIFQLITDHSDSYPAWLLVHSPEKWCRYKKIVKFINKSDIYKGSDPFAVHLLSRIKNELEMEGLYPLFAQKDIDKILDDAAEL